MEKKQDDHQGKVKYVENIKKQNKVKTSSGISISNPSSPFFRASSSFLALILTAEFLLFLFIFVYLYLCICICVCMYLFLCICILTAAACSQSSQLETVALRMARRARWNDEPALEENPFLGNKIYGF